MFRSIPSSPLQSIRAKKILKQRKYAKKRRRKRKKSISATAMKILKKRANST